MCFWAWIDFIFPLMLEIALKENPVFNVKIRLKPKSVRTNTLH